MAVAALGVFLAAARAGDPPLAEVVVLTRPVDAGGTLGAADMTVAPIDLPPAQAAQAFGDPQDLIGAVALGPLRSGELVQAGSVLAPAVDHNAESTGLGHHEFSFRLPRDQAVNGGLNRGERIDVLATFGTGDQAETWVMVRDVLVTQVDNSSEATLGAGSQITLTLALPDPGAVLRVTHAKDVALITVVRTTRGLDLPAGPDSYPGPTRLTTPQPPTGPAAATP
jgi:predicted RecA/RadA family phage recombinase